MRGWAASSGRQSSYAPTVHTVIAPNMGSLMLRPDLLLSLDLRDRIKEYTRDGEDIHQRLIYKVPDEREQPPTLEQKLKDKENPRP
jgi:hypothetical protein